MTKKRSNTLAMANRHLRLIAKLSYHYWRGLPPHTRAHLDLEELIATVVLSVTKSSSRYEGMRGAETTFVHHVAENALKNIAAKYQQPKRAAFEIIALEDWSGGSVPAFHLRWLEAKTGFERVLQCASDSLRETLEVFFRERRFASIQPEALDELRSLVIRHGVSRDDFAAVLRVI